jgi:hypothetical protein
LKFIQPFFYARADSLNPLPPILSPDVGCIP